MSETSPNSAPTNARETLECPGNACNHARNAHSWCVSKTPRHPTGQATGDRTASSPRLRGSSRYQKPAPTQRQRMHGRPWNVPGMHAAMHETHTRGAFRRLHGTLLGRQPAIERRHSRACRDPVDARNRPQFSVNGCTGAPGLHRYCMSTCTKRALAARFDGCGEGCRGSVGAFRGFASFRGRALLPCHLRDGCDGLFHFVGCRERTNAEANGPAAVTGSQKAVNSGGAMQAGAGLHAK